nr:hotdog domain-containing protein [Brevibacterium daeguense]
MRGAQEAVTRSRPSPEAAQRVTALLAEVQSVLGDGVEEDEQLAGRLWEEAGRAQALAPALHLDEISADSARGRVTFGRFHAGHAAAHGGVIPLVFDEIMGRLARSHQRPVARTAYLYTDYRAKVPLETEIEVRARLDSVKGRKVFLRSELVLEGTVLTECRGLWVQLRPGDY